MDVKDNELIQSVDSIEDILPDDAQIVSVTEDDEKTTYTIFRESYEISNPNYTVQKIIPMGLGLCGLIGGIIYLLYSITFWVEAVRSPDALNFLFATMTLIVAIALFASSAIAFFAFYVWSKKHREFKDSLNSANESDKGQEIIAE